MTTATQTQTVNPIQEIKPTAIPSGYAALGVQSGYHALAAKDLRMFIIGPEGMGKTTFAMGSPRTLVLDFDGGAWGVPYARANYLRISTAEGLHTVTDKLVADVKAGPPKSLRPFDRVVFDTGDQMLDVLNPELAERHNKGIDITQYGAKGAGYSLWRSAFWEEIQKVQAAGYAWTVVGHITEKFIIVNKKEKTVLRPVMFDSLAKQIARNCEIFANIYTVTETEQLYTTKDYKGQPIQVPAGTKSVRKGFMDISGGDSPIGTFQGKNRGVPTIRTKIELPDPMSGLLGWDVFEAEYNAAVTKIQNQIKQ